MSETTTEMKTLGNLTPAPGSHRKRKRLGRGIGSGLGKTSGKGHKGQKARTGGKVRPGFEGGQMPLYMRLPKRGFKNANKVFFNLLNLDVLSAKFSDGDTVDLSSLKAKGLIRDEKSPVKLLARGTLDKKLDVQVHKASEAAQKAVKDSGGNVTLLETKRK